MKLGDIEILPVHDGVGHEVAANILSRPGVGHAWECHQEKLDENGVLDFDLGGFLVRTGDRVVLIDAGAGDVTDLLLPHGGRYSGGDFLDSLRRYGLTPEDVTDVCLTHLHWDHVGWASHKGEIVFPNATYRLHQTEWEHFVERGNASPAVLTSILPVQNRIEPFSEDFTIAPGLDSLHTPGHTPGSVSYVVSRGKQRAIMLGDAAHSVVELEERDWEALYDVDPAAASAVRNSIADEAVDTEDLVVGAHFPDLRFGRLITIDGERRFRPV
ncbi:MBL fold metallo-hydrolase [Streptomyces sp. WG-D5]